MKKIAKILSSVLAASMVVSAFAMNVFAASTAHTITITPDKTTGLVAGDTVVIEVTMDNTENLVSCGYTLTYDATAFTADTTKVSRLEKCIDSAWMSDIKNADGDWAYYLGNPTYNVANAGEMKFSWAGSSGVEAEYAMDNRVIGKFNLTVAEGAADGDYTFALTGVSMDAGENSSADMVCAPVTVTVGSGEVEETTKTVAFTADLAAIEGTKYMFSVADETADLKADTDAFEFVTDVVAADSVTVGLIIENVPVDNVLSAVAKLVF